MTVPRILPGGSTWHGLLPDTDPIYQGGWNFLVGKNVYAPHIGDPDPPAKPMNKKQMRSAAEAIAKLLVRLR